MKFVLACYGMRGDVENSVVVGRELLHRGHNVHIAVPPNLVGFAEAAGLAAVAYGLDSRALSEAQRNYWACFFRKPWRIQDLDRLGREISDFVTRCWTSETTTTLTSLADGADLVIAGLGFEQFAANVAEYYDLPLATLHMSPMRPNGQLLPLLPAPLGRRAMTAWDRLSWGGAQKDVEDAQRRELGLAKATCPWPQRIAERGSLEIQAYDEVCFPGLAAEWAKWDGQRPFVGTLTLELPADADDEAESWIAAGTPPIYFGFGSIAVGSAAETLAMINSACEQIGERALVSAGGTDFSNVPQFRARQGGGPAELRGDLSAVPRGRAPRWLRRHRREPARRSSAGDSLDPHRSGWLWSCGQTIGGRHRPAPLDYHREIARRGPPPHPCPSLPHPSPRHRHPDDQTHRKRHGRR